MGSIRVEGWPAEPEAEPVAFEARPREIPVVRTLDGPQLAVGKKAG